ncbi:hypothetical protein NPIL_565211 [Nephila pilipes]|uniref:Uncharacterized protein n=1 Tax=Nephila pilipes TaxID=299642 RepID=A0A8X6R667_NEPPI|nr:hypothetical protein NPIL_565211 [Nephila pilipes]
MMQASHHRSKENGHSKKFRALLRHLRATAMHTILSLVYTPIKSCTNDVSSEKIGPAVEEGNELVHHGPSLIGRK